MKAKNSSWTGIIAFSLLLIHIMVIAKDVQMIMQDPNEDNKPAEVLKTVIDVTRYFG